MTAKSFVINSIIVLSSISVLGQAGNSVEKAINHVVSKGIDTFVTISVSTANSAPHTVKGLGHIISFSEHYLFYKKDAAFFSVKIIEHMSNDSHATVISTSKRLKSGVDSIFSYITENDSNIRDEYIKPYQYRDFDSTKGVEVFRILRTSHAPICKIYIHIGSNIIAKTVNLDDILQNRWDDVASNLNHDFNSNTKLSQLLGILTRLIERQDALYSF